MKKFSKRILSIILCVALVVTTCLSVLVVDAAAVTNPGAQLTYTFDKTSGVLTISGTGEMYDFRDTSLGTNKTAPWSSVKPDIKSVVIGEGVTSIGDYAFYNCSNLVSVSLPSTLKSIHGFGASGGAVSTSSTLSYGAFRDCVSLKNINFPQGLETIEPVSFRGCTSLENVVIPDSVTSLGTAAFVNCSGIRSVTFGAGLTEIPVECFYKCTNLLTVNWGPNIHKVNEWAFYNTRLNSIDIPEQITSIDGRGFADCYHLLEATIHNVNCSIADLAFNNTQLTKPQDFTVKGHSGSTAQTFAEKRGYTFISLDDCAHTSTHDVIVTPATCTENGLKNVVCDSCENIVSSAVITAPGHAYPAGQDVVRDDTNIDGHIRTFQTCSVCDYENVVLQHARKDSDSTININNFVWIDGYYDYTNTATCQRTGVETYRCTVDGCNQIETHVVRAGGHKVEAWNTTKRATCTVAGSKTGTCTLCGDTVVEEIAPLGHTVNKENGPSRTVDRISVNGHIYNYYACSVCGGEEEEVVHSEWIDGEYTPTVITAAGCVIDGTERDNCDICGETRLVTIKAPGAHEWEVSSVVPASCTVGEQTNYACKNCNLTKADRGEALGHDYQKVPELCVAATCTVAGSLEYICSRCNAAKSDPIPATGHKPRTSTLVVTKTADCEHNGARSYTCSVCENTITDEVIPALGHDFKDVDVAISDKPGHAMSTPVCQRSGCKTTQAATMKHVEWIDGYYTRTVITEPTCLTGEVSTDKCDICGENRTNNEGRPLGHEYRFVRVVTELRNDSSDDSGSDNSNFGSTIDDIIGGIRGDEGDSNNPSIEIERYSVYYICKHCGSIEHKNGGELWYMWDNYFYNTVSEGRVDQINTTYLEVTGDGFINAKDYAQIYNLNKQYQVYIQQQSDNI